MRSGYERAAILHLRTSGPCSIHTLARLAQIDCEQMYRAVYRLRAKNIASRLGSSTYDLTRRGERVFREMFVEPAALPLWQGASTGAP